MKDGMVHFVGESFATVLRFQTCVFDVLINVKFHISGYTSVSQAKDSKGAKKVMNVSVTIP